MITEATKRAIKTSAQKRRMKILEVLGGKCVRCGFTDPHALQIDHIFGDGAEKRSLGVSLTNEYEEIMNGSKDYQLLCANCNWIKRAENGEFRRNKLNHKDWVKHYFKEDIGATEEPDYNNFGILQPTEPETEKKKKGCWEEQIDPETGTKTKVWTIE